MNGIKENPSEPFDQYYCVVCRKVVCIPNRKLTIDQQRNIQNRYCSDCASGHREGFAHP